MKRFIPLLVLAALLTFVLVLPIYSSVAIAADDAGVVTMPPDDAGPVRGELGGSGIQPTPAPAPSSPAITPDSDEATLAQALWNAIQSKDWFMAVGVGVALLIHLARYLLKKKWPDFEKDRWGWVLAAVISGVVAVAAAWMAGADAASSRTLIGALKVLASAIATYVSTKKLAAPTK